jgi:integrase-like protein
VQGVAERDQCAQSHCNIRIALAVARQQRNEAFDREDAKATNRQFVAAVATDGTIGRDHDLGDHVSRRTQILMTGLIGFKLLYSLIIVRLHRRDLVWINVTTNPTAEWVALQITEAFPWDGASHYMIRDRDRIYGTVVTRRLRAMGIRDKPIAPASPWQNRFAERLIGSIRREGLDHVIILGEANLRRILKSYADYYNSVRTHRSLHKDAPISRPVQRTGVINSRAILGGLHHHYARV